MRRISMVGKRFGRLVVLRFAGIDKRRNALWLCRCDCGKETIVQGMHLLSMHTRSCGCLCIDRVRKANTKHGGATRSGWSKEYRAWKNMKSRCLDPNSKRYCDYGGRGITICERWLHSFENFLADVRRAPGPEYSIDRINNDGNYEPGNVRWATRKQQRQNRRRPKIKTEEE